MHSVVMASAAPASSSSQHLPTRKYGVSPSVVTFLNEMAKDTVRPMIVTEDEAATALLISGFAANTVYDKKPWILSPMDKERTERAKKYLHQLERENRYPAFKDEVQRRELVNVMSVFKNPANQVELHPDEGRVNIFSKISVQFPAAVKVPGSLSDSEAIAAFLDTVHDELCLHRLATPARVDLDYAENSQFEAVRHGNELCSPTVACASNLKCLQGGVSMMIVKSDMAAFYRAHVGMMNALIGDRVSKAVAKLGASLDSATPEVILEGMDGVFSSKSYGKPIPLCYYTKVGRTVLNCNIHQQASSSGCSRVLADEKSNEYHVTYQVEHAVPVEVLQEAALCVDGQKWTQCPLLMRAAAEVIDSYKNNEPNKRIIIESLCNHKSTNANILMVTAVLKDYYRVLTAAYDPEEDLEYDAESEDFDDPLRLCQPFLSGNEIFDAAFYICLIDGDPRDERFLESVYPPKLKDVRLASLLYHACQCDIINRSVSVYDYLANMVMNSLNISKAEF